MIALHPLQNQSHHVRMPDTKQRSFTAIRDMSASQCRCKVGPVHDWLQRFAGHARLLLVYAQRSAYPLRGGAVAWVQDRIGSDPPESDGSLAAHLLRLRDPNTGQKISDDRLLPHVGCISPLFWFLLPLCKGFGRGQDLHDFQPSLGSSKLRSICCNPPVLVMQNAVYLLFALVNARKRVVCIVPE